MNKDASARTRRLIGEQAQEALESSAVLIVGLGGVGAFAAEAIARAGVGKIGLLDFDSVSISNINRQLLATHSTIGKPKVEVMKARILDINPQAEVCCYNLKYTVDSADSIPLSEYNYIVDAIDTVKCKVELIVRAKHSGVPIISSMGTGNKLAAERFELTDLFSTDKCHLARIMRKRLRKFDVTSLPVVFSSEHVLDPIEEDENAEIGRHVDPGSISYMPGTAGLLMASYVIRELIKPYLPMQGGKHEA